MPSFVSFPCAALLFFFALFCVQSSAQLSDTVEIWCDRLDQKNCLLYPSHCNPYYFSDVNDPTKQLFAGCAYGSVKNCEQKQKNQSATCVKYANLADSQLHPLVKGCPSSSYFTKWDCAENGRVRTKLLSSVQSTDKCVKSTLYKGDVGFALEIEPLSTLQGDITSLLVNYGAAKNLTPLDTKPSATAGEHIVPLFGLPFASPSIRVLGAHVTNKTDLDGLQLKFTCTVSPKKEPLGDLVVKLTLKVYWPRGFHTSTFVKRLAAALDVPVESFKVLRGKIDEGKEAPAALEKSFPYNEGEVVLEFRHAQNWRLSEKLALMVRIDHPKLRENQLSISQVHLKPNRTNTTTATSKPTTGAPTTTKPTTSLKTQQPTMATSKTTKKPTTKPRKPKTQKPTDGTTTTTTTTTTTIVTVIIRLAQKPEEVSASQLQSDLVEILQITKEEVKVVSITSIRTRQADAAGSEAKVEISNPAKAYELIDMINSQDPRLSKSSFTFLSATSTDITAATSTPSSTSAPTPAVGSEKISQSGRSSETSRTAVIVIVVSISVAIVLALTVMGIAWYINRRPTPSRLMY